MFYYNGQKADVFSLGILLFTMYFGMPPFKVNAPDNPLVQAMCSGHPEMVEAFFDAHPITSPLNKKGLIP